MTKWRCESRDRPPPAIWSPAATNATHLSIHFQRSATAGPFWVKNRVDSFKVYSCYIENEEIQSVKNIRCVSVKYIELHPYISTWEGNLISKCVLGLSHSAPTQTEIPMFFITLSVKLHGGEIWCFFEKFVFSSSTITEIFQISLPEHLITTN